MSLPVIAIIIASLSALFTASNMHALSPLHTSGPWDGAAPELLLSRVRGGDQKEVGYFATGLPELPSGIGPYASATTLPAAVIGP
jgi:hypothetical protein